MTRYICDPCGETCRDPGNYPDHRPIQVLECVDCGEELPKGGYRHSYGVSCGPCFSEGDPGSHGGWDTDAFSGQPKPGAMLGWEDPR